MRLQDLNWMDVERYLETDTRIILLTGATEQHAYLSLMTDILIPQSLADAITTQENVLVAPPLNFGISRMFYEYPGTISFSKHTFDFALLEIVESLLHQGFRRFFILNGHGGNELPERLDDFQHEEIVRVRWYNWWQGDAAHTVAEKYNLQIDHANWGENFRFNRVADSPNEIKAPVNTGLTDMGHSMRDVLGDGSFGGPYQVKDEIMQEMFNAVVVEAVGLLRDMAD